MPERTAFEERLDNDLRAYLDPHAVGGIPAWRMPEPSRSGRRLLGGAGAALGAKIAVGAVIAVMAAGATTEAVITRSANPADWARHVTQQVQPSIAPAQSQPVPATASAAASPVPSASSQQSPVVKTPALPSVPAVPTPSLPVHVPTPTPLPSLP